VADMKRRLTMPAMRFRLRTLLIVLALGPPVVWLTYKSALVPIPAETIQSPAEFKDVIAAGNFVMHVDVDWSTQAVINRTVINRLRSKITFDPRCNSVRWRRFDCTYSDTALWHAIDEWLGSQDVERRSLESGYGALIWVKDGRVVDSLRDASLVSEDRLFTKTLKAFE
jgi:hypothetical protein